MALEKQNLNINFSQGLDTKTDPWQVPAGKFLSLQNSIFNKGGLLQKRNGFGSLPSLENTTSNTLTTFDGNLLAIGNTFNILSQDTNQWFDKGTIQPMSVSTTPVVRNSSGQLTVDAVIASNNLVCAVFQDSDGNSYYQIADSETGQIIIQQTQLPATATQPRVFLLGSSFFITFLATVSAATHLQFITIPINIPTSPTSAQDIFTTVDGLTAGYDGYVYNNQFYVAASMVSATILIHVAFVTANNFTVSSPSSFTIALNPDEILVSVTVDPTTTNVWVTLLANIFGSTQAFRYSNTFSSQLTQLQIAKSLGTDTKVYRNVTTSVRNNVLSVYYEVINNYTYEAIESDYINFLTYTYGGSVSSPVTIIRGVGLASKCYYYETAGLLYFLVAYGGAYQPTYFLIDQNGTIVSKLAYSNGGGYTYNQILPQLNLRDDVFKVGYLFKDLLVSVNKNQSPTSVGGLYSQTGINLVSFAFNSDSLIASEIGNNLHLTGGYLSMYDGVKPVEHGFHVWPEDLGVTTATTGGPLISQDYFYQATYEWTDAQGNLHRSAPSIPLEVDLTDTVSPGISFTARFTTGDTTLSASSGSTAGLFVGQRLSDLTTPGNLDPNTTITEVISITDIRISHAMLATNVAGLGDTFETLDTFKNTIHVPTLRLTQKTGSNTVRIVIYRWSTAQQVFYQLTSISSPIANDTTIDSISFEDIYTDSQILGNVILYTTGGVIENIAAPSCTTQTLFKSRLVLVDAENQNLLWFSKQVIDATPVEMSDLFTLYVAPTISAQGSTGPITALSAMDDKLIIFKKDAIYYVTGSGPDNTGTNNDFSDPVFITSTVGCTNQRSIVFMPQGLMFQSDKGIWLLGRDLSTTYIGAPVEAYNESNIQSAINIPATNQVRFTLNTGVTLMYDYFFGQWGTFTNIPALSSTIYQGLHTYLNSFGQVFQETPQIYLDGSRPVVMSFTTSWLNLAGLQGFERAYFFYILGNYLTPHKLSVQISYDYNPYPTQSSLIQPVNYSANYGGDALYGSGSPYGGGSKVEQWRVFLQQQKCESFQITISEIYDPSFGVSAGAGLTLSGLDLVIGTKSGYPRLRAAVSTG